MFSNVLIVCYANVCRSPAAEMILKTLHRQRSKKAVTYHSAGIRAFDGLPIDATMDSLLRERGVASSNHQSRRLNARLVREADLVLVAERNQIGSVEEIEPTSRGKVFAFGNWEGVDVIDPHGKTESSYRAALTLIERLATGWIDRIC